jgi:hypothetical protein
MFTTSGTYPWSLVTQIFHNGQPSHGGDRKTFKVTTSTSPIRTLGSVSSLSAATLYQGHGTIMSIGLLKYLNFLEDSQTITLCNCEDIYCTMWFFYYY